MEAFSMLLALCAGNSPATSEIPAQRPGTRSFDIFFDQRRNKRLSKLWWDWRSERPSLSLWRHCNGYVWLIMAMCIIVLLVPNFIWSCDGTKCVKLCQTHFYCTRHAIKWAKHKLSLMLRSRWIYVGTDPSPRFNIWNGLDKGVAI